MKKKKDMTEGSMVIRQRLNELKIKTFYELLDLAGRVFLIIRYSEDVRIGTRGFLPEEKKNGLVLVLNKKMKFSWEDGVLECRLVFGSKPHSCLIPEDHIIGVHSPELNTQLIIAPYMSDEKEQDQEERKSEKSEESLAILSPSKSGDNVVKVDFTRKRR